MICAMTIATLTLNPTIDVAYEVDHVFHTRKMRTKSEFYAPGGGGINVARVFVRLGGNARSYYLSGGATGHALDGLLDLHQMVRNRIPIKGHTRVASAVLERDSGKEYRFVPPGPAIGPEEWQECLNQLETAECDYMIASGSLPPGVPDDFYGRLVAGMTRRKIPVVLDSSGPGLRGGLEQGGVFPDAESATRAAMQIVEKGQAAHVAVTMGHAGALLVSADRQLLLPALQIEARSAVGAGDSFLSAMIFAISLGWEIDDAFRFGIAAGGAAVLNPGHDLARPEEIRRLYPMVPRIP
jgi:6-phosphofructokinase 2